MLYYYFRFIDHLTFIVVDIKSQYLHVDLFINKLIILYPKYWYEMRVIFRKNVCIWRNINKSTYIGLYKINILNMGTYFNYKK